MVRQEAKQLGNLLVLLRDALTYRGGELRKLSLIMMPHPIQALIEVMLELLPIKVENGRRRSWCR